MSLVRSDSNGKLARDPYSFARDLFGWDPFFGARQVSAFAPTFEVKETHDAFASQRIAVQVFDPAASSRAVFELGFGGSKLSLRVPAGFDEGELRRLVAILREPC